MFSFTYGPVNRPITWEWLESTQTGLENSKGDLTSNFVKTIGFRMNKARMQYFISCTFIILIFYKKFVERDIFNQ